MSDAPTTVLQALAQIQSLAYLDSDQDVEPAEMLRRLNVIYGMAGYWADVKGLQSQLTDESELRKAALATVDAFYTDVDDSEDAIPISDTEVEEAVDRLRAALSSPDQDSEG